MKKFIQQLEVMDSTADSPETMDSVYLGLVEVIFHNEKYYELKLTFPDGSFRKLFIPQSSRLAKIDYKSAK